jgi:inorganic pyrophosphatase/exopolyphosphatase
MNRQIVTSGSKYTDIDAFASIIAYAELTGAAALVRGNLNASVPGIVKNMGFKFFSKPPFVSDEFVIVDVSDPSALPDFVDVNKVVKVYDHHAGHEAFWGPRGNIEKVGAAATQIFELFGDKNPTTKNANLLYIAIMANSLCLRASVTNKRDVDAIKKLSRLIDLPDNFMELYYAEIEKSMLENLDWSLRNDIKNFPKAAFAQLELWDAENIIARKSELAGILKSYKNWILNLVSIKDGASYFITESEFIRKILQNNLKLSFKGNMAKSDKLILRKEIGHIFN